jgi:hypothetical protein
MWKKRNNLVSSYKLFIYVFSGVYVHGFLYKLVKCICFAMGPGLPQRHTAQTSRQDTGRLVFRV